MGAPPLISVVMAVHDGASLLDETIGSVLAQSHERLELLVVDDGSTDGTAEIVRDRMRRDRRVTLLEGGHSGQALALNHGILAAQGPYIARIDHDDLWHRDRLAAQLEHMHRERVDVCGCWARRIGDAHGLIRFPRGHEAIRYEALFTCPILDSATLFAGDVLRANPYPESAVVRTEMVQLLRLLPDHRFANLPRALASYRIHAGQKTKRLAGLAVYRQRQLQQQHFAQLVPDATAEERATFALVADGSALAEEELLRIADLFVRRLRPADGEARRRIAFHWRRLVARRAPSGSVRALRHHLDAALLATSPGSG
jgi:glycosyltransferase involved in cell wall biosynthesis